MKKRIIVFGLTLCFLIVACGKTDETSQPDKQIESGNNMNSQAVQEDKESVQEPVDDPAESGEQPVDDEGSQSQEETGIPGPSKEILEAGPKDCRIQLYDHVFTNKTFFYFPSDFKQDRLPDRNYGNWKILCVEKDLPWEKDTRTLIDKIEKETSLNIVWQDYDPDTLLTPGYDYYFAGKDEDGTLIYGICAFNDTAETISLADAKAFEMYHISTESPDSAETYSKYAYFFGGINAFSGEWTYERVKEKIGEYSDFEVSEEQFGDDIVISMSLETADVKGHFHEDHGDIIKDISSNAGRIQYRFKFNASSHVLYKMDFRIYEAMLMDDVVEYTVPEIGRY